MYSNEKRLKRQYKYSLAANMHKDHYPLGLGVVENLWGFDSEWIHESE